LCAYFAAKRIRLDVVHEGSLPVDLHHREPLAVLGLELRLATDVDLLELEWDVGADGFQHSARAFAEVATLRVIEDDLRDKCRA
jgi:hypothetical protein